MERLTYKITNIQTGDVLSYGLNSGCNMMLKGIQKLGAYEDAEEQGLLLRLPVAIGSTIYHFEYPTKIDDDGTEWSILDKKRATIKPMKFALCHLDSIGKLYFLTKEEAEQALKDMKGDFNEQTANVWHLEQA